MQHRDHAGLDPGESLRRTIEESLSPDARVALDLTAEELGKRVLGFFFNRVSGTRVRDPRSEAEDLFQKFCIRVLECLRRKRDGEVTAGWFWSVANSVFFNHLNRKLGKRKNEQSLELSDAQTDHLEQALTGSVAIEQPDSLADESVDNLVLRCLDRIPPRMAELLYLDLIERLPTKAIVAKMGLEPKSFAACKAKAIIRLRDEIKKAIVSP